MFKDKSTEKWDAVAALPPLPQIITLPPDLWVFKINSSNYNNLSDSTIDDGQNLIAIAEDSLYQQSDSLSHDPTLLISKDK